MANAASSFSTRRGYEVTAFLLGFPRWVGLGEGSASSNMVKLKQSEARTLGILFEGLRSKV